MKKIFFNLVLLSLVVVFAGAGCVSVGKKKQTVTAGVAGMFVSADKGNTWQQISFLPTATGVKNISNIDVYRLFTDPQDPNALYWATRANGYLYSYDEGRTWQQSGGELQAGYVYGLVVHPKNKCLIYVTNGSKIYKTEDCNRSWQELYRESRPNIRVVSLAVNPFTPYEVFAVENNGDLLESKDGGVSWSTIKRFNIELVEMIADPTEKDLFYMTTRTAGLYRSKDAGITWESLLNNMKEFPKSNDYRRFLVYPGDTNKLYWISTYGILKSEDRGNTWSAIDLITPPGSAQIYGFYVNPKNDKEIYYTATINDRSTFYKSEDGGVKWMTKSLPSGQLPTLLYIHPEKDSMIYLGFSIIPKK